MERKGKTTFTAEEINALRKLIRQRVGATRNEQKAIRNKMREIGFYGSEFGIFDCQPEDLERLIQYGAIRVAEGRGKPVSPIGNKTKEVKRTQDRPWFKRANIWGWIVASIFFLATIIIIAVDLASDEKADANQQRPRSYEEVFTPEEAKKMGIGGHIDGSGDWKPDPNTAQRAREFIEKGGNADPQLDAIQDGDYHDLLDQMGGPEGF